MKTNKTILILGIALLIFNFFIRLYKIDANPSVISHDEVYYMTEAKTILLDFSDPSGTWSPLSLTSANPLYAELPGFVMSILTFFTFDNPLLAAKITHIVLTTGLCFILGYLSYLFTKNIKFAFLTTILATVNPWLFQFSRMGFDSIFSLFFYFLGITLYIRNKSYHKLWALIPFFIGFFQYQGLKIVFVPLIFLTVVYVYLQEQKTITKNNKYIYSAITLIFAVLLFSITIFRLQNQKASDRAKDIIFSDHTYNTTNVFKQRQQAIDTNYNKFFINKFTVISERFLNQYLESFSPQQLFLKGEALRNPFSVFNHGMFYLIDLPLILLGLFFLLKEEKTQKTAIYLLSLILIAPLPSAINSTGIWIMFRSSLMIPVFVILSSYGLYVLWQNLNKYLFAILIILYVVFVTRFFFFYFHTYPILGTSGEYFSERILANYIKRNPELEIKVYANEPKFVFESILVYNNLINSKNLPAINEAMKTEKYQLENFVVDNKCVTSAKENPNTTIIAHAVIPNCDGSNNETELTSQIAELTDSRGVYKLYNDSFCLPFGLDRFSHINQDVFAVEKLDDAKFCKSFLISN